VTSRPDDKSKERTKEEILQQRKAMMKSKVKKKDNFGQQPPMSMLGEANQKMGAKEPLGLMHRLAKGEKPKVSHSLNINQNRWTKKR
jgi:hypothetical protein